MVWAQQERVRIISWITKMFIEAEKLDKGLVESGVISEICMKKGSTKKKAKEYINDLIEFGIIEKDGDGLWLSKKYVSERGLDEEAEKIDREAEEVLNAKPEL